MGKYQEAWQKGVDIGKDLNEARAELRAEIAKRIKEKRKEAGLSQEEMSERIHANFLTYKGYENFKSDIPMVYLVRIADVLDLSLDYLAGRTEEERQADTLEERIAKLESIIMK